MSKDQIIDLVLLHDEELAKLKKALPAIRAQMEEQLGEKVAELSTKHGEVVRAELAVKQLLISKEAAAAARFELLAQAGSIKNELAAFAEHALASLLVKHEGKIAEIAPQILELAKAAASQVTKEYAAKQPDLPALIKKEFAGATSGAVMVNAFKGPWQDNVNYRKGDIVYFRGSSYLVLQTTRKGDVPNMQNQGGTSATYLVLAGAGNPGPKGLDGVLSGVGVVTSLTVTNLTSGRVPFVTTGGAITDSSSLTFNSGTGILSATGFIGNTLTSVAGQALSLATGTRGTFISGTDAGAINFTTFNSADMTFSLSTGNGIFQATPGQALIVKSDTAATGGATTKSSPTLQLLGFYWTGAASASKTATLGMTASTTVANNSLDMGFTDGGGTQIMRLFQDGRATFVGAITTGAPSGGTAAAWKHGIAAVVSPTSPNRTIELDVGGTIYYLAAKTTNN